MKAYDWCHPGCPDPCTCQGTIEDNRRAKEDAMAQYGRYDVIRYPDGYAVQDMSKDGHPVVFSTKNRDLAHAEARRLEKEERHGND